MRSKFEILKLKVSKFNRELKSLERRIDLLMYRREQEVKRVFEKYFASDLQEGIIVSHLSSMRIEYTLLDDTYNTITIKRIDKQDVERGTWSDELVDFKAYTNGMSLKNVEEMELRANLQISIAQLFNDFKDDAMAEVNYVQEKYDKFIGIIVEASREKRNEIEPFRTELRVLKEVEIEKKLLEGIEFELQETRWGNPKYPALEVKYDWTINNVKRLKVRRFSASRKSADIEVIQEWKDYDGKVSTRTENIERVRVDKFKNLVKLS